MRGQPDRLFHYCCAHSAIDIRREMQLDCAARVVARHLGKTIDTPQGYVVWLTDMEPPAHRDALGLSMHDIECDRIEYCFEVKPDWSKMEWWMTFRKRHRDLLALERYPGVMPAHWYVGQGPIAVLHEVAVK